MSSVGSAVERGFEPPGQGPWELESTHFSRPVTAFAQAPFADGFVRGFTEGTSRHGLLLDHMEPGFSRAFMYTQPVAFGAPKGAMGPPPKPVLQLLTRLHPAFRRRIKRSAKAIEGKWWREDLQRWDEADKPAAIARHRSVQAVDVVGSSDEELAQHLVVCAEHMADSIYLHHKYTIPACLPVGDFLAGATDWTGRTSGELLGLLRGRSAISRGFAAVELEDAGKAIASSDPARAILSGPSRAGEKLEALAADPVAGPAVSAYLDAVRWRSVGYDVADKTAGEMPDMLVATLGAAVSGAQRLPGRGHRSRGHPGAGRRGAPRGLRRPVGRGPPHVPAPRRARRLLGRLGDRAGASGSARDRPQALDVGPVARSGARRATDRR